MGRAADPLNWNNLTCCERVTFRIPQEPLSGLIPANDPAHYDMAQYEDQAAAQIQASLRAGVSP